MMPVAMEAIELPPAPKMDRVIRKPRRQPIPEPIVFAERNPEVLEPVGIERLWYDYDDEPVEETAKRFWNEIDQIDLPLEGEPHDLWWSTAKGNAE